MRKVAQVLYSGLGGHGNVAFALLNSGVAANAWTGHMLFFGIEPVVGEYERACRVLSAQSDYVPTTPGRAWRSWPALFRALRRARPDAIILHSVKTILPCAFYACLNRIPLVAVEHQPNALKHIGEWRASRLLMKLADAVVVLTEDYCTQLRDRLGFAWNNAKVHLIPNGIDTSFYAPAIGTPSRQQRIIGMAARMSRTKRQDILIRAVAQLLAEDGPGSWQLTLAGDGETAADLLELVETLELRDVVTFTGTLDSGELKEWFGSIGLYAHASEGETLSTSLLQAMACSLPIVGSNVSGISNLLSPNAGTGLLATQTPEAFADALRRLASDTKLADSLRRRARELAVAEFSQGRMFERYSALLDRLCIE